MILSVNYHIIQDAVQNVVEGARDSRVIMSIEICIAVYSDERH